MSHHGWESCADGRRVLFSESVAVELRMVAIKGFTALRRRGLEMGGLLFGGRDSGEWRIEGLLEVPCEHRYGPSYTLSDTDREKLTELLARRRPGPTVVGFYRSVTGRELAVEPADEAMIAEYFGQGDVAFLLLQPLSAEKCVGHLRFFHDGQLLPTSEEAPFPFEPKRMPVMQMVMQEGPQEEVPIQADELVPQQPSAVLPPPRRRMHAEPGPEPPAEEPVAERVVPVRWESEPAPRRSGLWKAALVGIAGALAGAFIYDVGWSQRAQPTALMPKWVELHLDAKPEGGKLDVSWDTAAVQSLDATRGALTIRDGSAQREIELGAPDVRAGKYTYAPEAPDVAVRLTVFAKGSTVAAESARVSRPAPAAPAAPAVLAPAPPPASNTTGVADVPPTAMREIRPSIPDGIRSRIEGRVAIPVEVRVDERGRVVSARSEGAGGDGLHRYLAGQAEKAAREWRFHPAKHAGAPVAASKRIEFVFTR